MSEDRFADELDPAAPAGSDAAARVRRQLSAESLWEQPSPGGEEQILAIIADARSVEEAQESDVDEGSPLLYRPAVIWLGAAAVLALIVLGALMLRPAPDDDRPTLEFALQGTELAEGARADAVITTTEAGFAIRLNIKGLAPAPEGSFYEGWVRGEGGSVSIGTFHMRGDAPIGLWSGVDPARYPVVNITLQEESAGPESSGLIVLTGQIPAD